MRVNAENSSILSRATASAAAGRKQALLLLAAFLLFYASRLDAEVGISDFNTLTLSGWTGSGSVEDEDGVCVFRSDGSSYRIVMTGSGAGGAFELTRGSANIEYSAYFKGSAGGFVSMSPNQGEAFCCADEVDADCSGSTNAAYRVELSESSLRSSPAGSYSGTLTVRLEPN